MPLDIVLRWLSIALFSILVPLGIYVGRMNVRASRREIVRDLERLFHFANAEGRPLILPSFELVKYKYDPELNPDRAPMDPDANSLRYYLFPVAIYVILTFLCFEIRLQIRRRAPYRSCGRRLHLEFLDAGRNAGWHDYLRIFQQLHLVYSISRPKNCEF